MDNFTEKLALVIVGAVIGAIASFIIFWIKRKDDYQGLIRNKTFEEKYKAYFDVVSLFFDLLKEDKGFKQFGKHELNNRYIDVKKSILLLGTDEIVTQYSEFDKIASDDKSPYFGKIQQWLNLMVLIRKDSGNPNTKLTQDDILKIILSDADYDSFKKLLEGEK